MTDTDLRALLSELLTEFAEARLALYQLHARRGDRDPSILPENQPIYRRVLAVLEDDPPAASRPGALQGRP